MTHVAVITPTRDRKPLLPIIERWVRRQAPDLTWIVVEDSSEPSDHITPDVYRHVPLDDPPDTNTVARNVMIGLEHVPKHATHIAFMEDDDWYHESFLSVMPGEVPRGTSETYQYNATTGEYRVAITPQARRSGMLCNTVLPIDCLPVAHRAAREMWESRRFGVDLRLWAYLKDGPRECHDAPRDRPIHLSFKGFPEGLGILRGFTNDHLGLLEMPFRDDGHRVLRELLGSDAEAYAPFIPGLVSPIR